MQDTLSVRNSYCVTSATTITFQMTFVLQDPEINTDYPKTEHKYHVEFHFLKSAPTTGLCESPALSVPTISITADDAQSEVQEEGTVEENEPNENFGKLVC